MNPLRCVLAALTLLMALGAVAALPTNADVERVALGYVRSLEIYVDNGGFDERVLDSGVGEKTSRVMVEFRTRHVGMLQMIGHFLCHVEINSSTLEVIWCAVEETHEQVVEPGVNQTDPDEGASDGEGSGDGDEGYAEKILYLINETRAMIYESGAENELQEALSKLDRAEDLVEQGSYEEALDLAMVARDEAYQHIYPEGSPGEPEEPEEPPKEDPGTEPGSDMPWLHGYIVVFDHDPGQDDWDLLESLYNASYACDATDYGTGEENAYWVRVSGVTPDALKEVAGVKDVIALRGSPGEPGDSDGGTIGENEAVPELAWVLLLLVPVLMTHRGARR